MNNYRKFENYKYLLLLIFVMVFSTTNIFSQTSTTSIKGVVKDDSGTLPGAYVLLKGSKISTITNENGEFSLNVPTGTKNPVITVSFIAMETMDIAFKGNPLNIIMKNDNMLDEVVITGIANRAKESYTGSVTSMNERELKMASSTGLVSAMQNIDPAFRVWDNLLNGSDPNSIPGITMRGSTSLTSNVKDIQSEARTQANNPLIIMDGFEISISDMMNLDENRVENITILKDAGATAIYGTRGANGVVVITTKTPEEGRLTVTYTGNYSLEVPDLSSYDLMDAREKLEFEVNSNVYKTNNPSYIDALESQYNWKKKNIERGVNTYWLKYPVRTGLTHRHSVRIEGGSKELKFAANVAYGITNGVMKGSDKKIFDGSIRLDYSLKSLSFANEISINNRNSENSPYGNFSDYTNMNSYFIPFDEVTGRPVKNVEDVVNTGYEGAQSSRTTTNPLYNVYLPSLDSEKNTRIRNNFSLTWAVLPSLKFIANFGITYENGREDKYLSNEHTSFINTSTDQRGSYRYKPNEAFGYNLNANVSFSKTYDKLHQIDIIGRFEVRQNKVEGYSITAVGIPILNMDFLGFASRYPEGASPYGSESVLRNVGGVATASYIYDRRYFIDASANLEASSSFGANERSAIFWSLGTGWNIHQEDFIKELRLIDKLRVKINYGTSGNANFNPYQSLTTYKSVNDNYNGWYGVQLMGIGNPNLSWQKTGQLSTGIEVEAFKRRLKVKFEYFDRRTDNLLADIDLPPSSGFGSYKSNVGEMVNKGIETSLNATIIDNNTERIYWNIGAMLNHTSNKVTKIDEDLLTQINADAYVDNADAINPSFPYKVGKAEKSMYAVRSKGIDPSTGREVFVKLNGDETFEWNARDQVYCGIAESKFFGNLSTFFEIKGFAVNVIFSYGFGGQMYNRTLANKIENINPLDNADRRALYDRWRKPGDIAKFKDPSLFSEVTKATSRFVMDDNYLQCSTIALSYQFPEKILEKIRMKYLNVKLSSQNPFRISTIKQERGTIYPFANSYSLTLTARF